MDSLGRNGARLMENLYSHEILWQPEVRLKPDPILEIPKKM